jgi:DNA processing protein
MQTFQEQHYSRIAFGLITSKYQKARRKVLKKNIGPTTLTALKSTELALLGFPEKAINAIQNNYIKIAEDEIKNAQQGEVEIIFHEDPYYPETLREIFDPPDFIYVLGNKEVLKTDKLAVVGSRKAGNYGRQCLERILPDICRAEITIVSGMAYGIDSMAHQVAVQEKKNTIGVNAGGLFHLYPAGNKGLIQQIREHGCIISEFALDTVPRPFYFPIRNRIIAGLSRAILVVEAALKSGSLITARLGLEQNRDIFAIPGRIDSPISAGTNYLIQQGAKLITSSKDILDEFGIVLEKEDAPKMTDFSAREIKILELMADCEIKSVDFLVDQLDESPSATISSLMGLILKSAIIEESGGYKRIV